MKRLKILINFFLIICCFFPSIATADDNGCVILLYHRFSDEEPKSTSTSPSIFNQHLEYLVDNKYKVLALNEVVKRLKLKSSFPEKCVSLTADDGFLSFYTEAYPLLKKYQLPMSVFISTEPIDKKYKVMMSWEQLRDMSPLVDIYNHSVSHLHMVDLNNLTIKNEINIAQQRLYKELNIIDKFFAYPYGEFDDNTYSLLEELEYVGFGQHSGVAGISSDLLNIPRFSMSGPYAKMDSFSLKIKTLHMPIESENPKSLIISGDFKPKLVLNFSRPLSAYEKNNFSCFISGQDQPKISWLSSQSLSVKSKEPLQIGRSRYNCTMPSSKKGRYFWYSKLWLRQ
jgi:peptidoglycan/xylan/chitin deacetylase (PgdA/CDA1 family)|tara:strand:+ start:7669 stop:8691 length:1023 start_codon:yes stop_codon:yes gene_type:complete